jgi:hypothetical protein
VASLDRGEFAIGGSDLLVYLEDDLRYLSEQLTWLEASWRKALVRRHDPMSARERQHALVTLGHILHAVEDYFFHTNLPEAHAWAAAAESSRPKTATPRRVELLTEALRETELDRQKTLEDGMKGLADLRNEFAELARTETSRSWWRR